MQFILKVLAVKRDKKERHSTINDEYFSQKNMHLAHITSRGKVEVIDTLFEQRYLNITSPIRVQMNFSYRLPTRHT